MERLNEIESVRLADERMHSVKKVLTGFSLLLLVQTGVAQTTSYSGNPLGILGTENTAMGFNILTFANASSAYNVGVGKYAIYNLTSAQENVAIGHSALGFSNGNRNTAGGHFSLGNTSTGTNNTAFGNRALTVNTTGSNNTAVGSAANVGSNALSNAAAIGANATVMNSNQMILGDNSVNVGIGLSGNATGPVAKLHAVTTAMGMVGVRGDGGPSNSIGVQGNAYMGVQGNGTFGVDGNGDLVGVRGSSFGSGGVGTKIGIRGGAGSGALNYAGYFSATGAPVGLTTYGVYSEIALPTQGGVNYGIYSSVGGNGSGSANPNSPSTTNNAGYFNGDVVTTSILYYFSDRRMKKEILKLDNSLSIINKLNPVTYNFDTQANPSIALPHEKQYGFISQEVQQILPELTKIAIHPAKHDESGKEIVPSKEVLGLNYNGFIAILTKGIQEQQLQIESQNKKIADLQEQVSTLTGKTGNATGINQPATAVDGFVLEQNIPNPFSNETVVKYTLPQHVNQAALVVYDLSGKQIASFPITEKGSSSMILTSEKLSAGIYIYSVIADGKILDSKRMVVSQK